MNTKLIGIDGRACVGILGTVFTTVITNYNLTIGALAGTFTAAYMGLKAWREWVKVKAEKRQSRRENTKE